MSNNKDDNPLDDLRESYLASEEPEVKAARKLYDQWVKEFIPLYCLLDTPGTKPKNWNENQIWTRVEGETESWLTNGFIPNESSQEEFVTSHYLTEKPCDSPRLTLKVLTCIETECQVCDGEGEVDDEECYYCDSSGYQTIHFDDYSSFGEKWTKKLPPLIMKVGDLPSPPLLNDENKDDIKPKFCIECGVKMVIGAKFCSECGTASA